MDNPKFNIITRYSREESIENCLRSLYGQTYLNFHHYITYENVEDLEYLKKITNSEKTTLVKVPKYNRIENLWIYYQYHDYYTNYLDVDWWEKSKLKIHYGDKSDIKPDDVELVEKVFKYEKDGFWCMTLDRMHTIKCEHFPYNLYLKIVESKINDGWIMYLDDDDEYESNDSLNIVRRQIVNTDEDTLQIYRLRTRGKGNTELLPHDGYLKYMKTGHPIIHLEVITSCFCFHSKYKDYTAWDDWRRADVRTVKSLERVIPKISYMDEVILKSSYREKIYDSVNKI